MVMLLTAHEGRARRANEFTKQTEKVAPGAGARGAPARCTALAAVQVAVATAAPGEEAAWFITCFDRGRLAHVDAHVHVVKFLEPESVANRSATSSR